MTKVKVRKGESLEQALRRFNREVHRAKIIQEVKDRERYVKPSEERRQNKKRLARKIYWETKHSN
jgi:small subunit ribosomal protein S21